ncbi:MAG: hypothetical protein ACT4PI_13680 [Actinomycetota bacterium]
MSDEPAAPDEPPLEAQVTRAWWVDWIVWPAGVVAGLLLAYFGLIWLLDQFITTEDERNAERLDQLESEVLELRLPGAERLDEFQTDDCSSQSFGTGRTLRFSGTKEEALSFYRERVFDRGWIETPPSYEGDVQPDFRKRFSWGYGFASVDIRGRTVTVEVGFNC